MSARAKAARAKADLWRAHDEKDGELAVESAQRLYSGLTGEDEDSYSIKLAAEMTKDAFWLADEAEKYRKEGKLEKEKRMYKRCARLFKEARHMVGLPWEAMDYRGEMWQAYRRGDEEEIIKKLNQEHLSDTGSEACAERATAKFLQADRYHKKREWDKVKKYLEDYYRFVLPELLEE